MGVPEPTTKPVDPFISAVGRLVDHFCTTQGGDSPYGQLLIANAALRRQAEEIVKLKEMLAKSEQDRTLAEQALTQDALTGIANEKGFIQELDRALKGEDRRRHEDSQDPFKGVVVLAIDLDRFKPINDTYGHPAGDAALKVFAEKLRSQMRPGDTVARLHGDEFAAIMPHTRTLEAASRLSALARTINEITFTYDGQEISFGGTVVACDCDFSLDAEGNAKKADLILTQVKETGRERARSAPSPTGPA